MSKLPVKRNHIIQIAIILGIFFFILLVVNVTLNLFRQQAQQHIQETFGWQVESSYLSYNFPSTIILHNVSINKLHEEEAVHASNIKLRLSLLNLLIKQTLFVSNIKTNYLTIHRNAIVNLLELSPTTIEGDGQNPFAFNFTLDLQNTTLLDSSNDQIYYQHGNFHLKWGLNKIDFSGTLNCSGQMNQQDFKKFKCPSSRVNPWKFLVNAKLKDNLIIPDKILVHHRRLKANFWFETTNDLLLLHGFMLAGKFNPLISWPSQQTALNRQTNKITHWLPKGTQTKEYIHTHILDINGILLWQKNHLVISSLSFLMDNFAVQGQIDLHTENNPKFNIDLTVNPAKNKADRFANFKSFTSTIQGELLPGQILWGAKSSLFFRQHPDIRLSINKLDIDVSTASYYTPSEHTAKVLMDKLAIRSFVNNEHQYGVSIKSVNLTIPEAQQGLQRTKLQGNIGEGLIHTNIEFKSIDRQLQTIMNWSLTNVTFNDIFQEAAGIPKIFGQLSGSGALETLPQLKITGNITNKQGNIEDADFFVWMSEAFDIPSIKNYPFNTMTGAFTFSKGELSITDAYIDGDDLDLKLNMRLRGNDTVIGDANLSFNRNTLLKSSKLKSIANFFPPTKEKIDVLLKLSGRYNAFNFQWANTPDKEVIQSRLPNFIERIIERKVEKNLAK